MPRHDDLIFIVILPVALNRFTKANLFNFPAAYQTLYTVYSSHVRAPNKAKHTSSTRTAHRWWRKAKTSRRVACLTRERHKLRKCSWIIRWSYYITATGYVKDEQFQAIISAVQHPQKCAFMLLGEKKESIVLVKNIECFWYTLCVTCLTWFNKLTVRRDDRSY